MESKQPKKIKQQWPHIRILILPLFRIPNRRWNRFATVQMVLLKSIETLELANTIRLIHKGGTLIDQGMSHKIFEKFDAQKRHHNQKQPLMS